MAALNWIGCPAVAALTQEAIDAIGIEGPLTVTAIESAMEVDSEARDDKLNDLDERYYDEAGDLSEPVFAFIRDNRGKITLM